MKDAEKLFVAIADSGYSFYSNKVRYSSDIPGDTTINTYGYGSFTSDDRNTACVYLTKIYIEQRKFSKALDYLNKAVNEYQVEYTCGTGYKYQQDKYNFLYATCYEGLGRYT